jgi:hypothetical protein
MYIKMFTTSILKCLKKNQILVKIFHLLSSTWTLFFKLPQILSPIRILVSSLKKHDYNNLDFEIHIKKKFLNYVLERKIIIPIKASTC